MPEIAPQAYVAAALLVLLLPLDWLLAAFLAAAFHELCHAAAILLLDGKIYGLKIGLGGASLETGCLSGRAEFFSAAAGPMGSFFLLLLCHVFPKLAICGLIQGLYNLLPVYPLDGGRLLRCILEAFLPESAEYWQRAAAMLSAGAVGVLIFIVSGRILPSGIALAWILGKGMRKRPCKRSRIGVQ